MEQDFSVYEKLLIAITVCILTINVYVASLFIRKPSLRQNSSLLLLSLTMADLFTGFVTVPLIIAPKAIKALDFETAKFFFIFGDIATVLSASLTIMSLCAVTADRYARLCHPMKHLILVRRNRIIALFCFIWIIAFGFAFIPLSWLYAVLKPNPSQETKEMCNKMDTEYSIAGAALFAIPIIGLTIAFLRMFYAIRKLGSDEQQLSIERDQEERRRIRERKAIVLFGSMFILFVVCWVPWITLRPFVLTAAFDEIPKDLLDTLVVIRFLTSVLNPVLYTLHEQSFYRALITDKNRLVMCCKLGRQRQRSTSIDSATKFALYRFNRKGTFTSTLKSQDDADNATSFMPNPMVTKNGLLHPGHVDIPDSNSSQAAEFNTRKDDLPTLTLRVPQMGNLQKEETDIIASDKPSTSAKSSAENIDSLKIEFNSTRKNLNICENEDGAFQAGGKQRKEVPLQGKRIGDLFGNTGGRKEIKSGNEDVGLMKKESIEEPLLSSKREGPAETVPMLKRNNYKQKDNCVNSSHMRALDSKDETRQLLNTSFIAKVFNANNIDVK